MNSRAGLFLTILIPGIILTAVRRLYAIYRRRRRWKLLTTSHSSLDVARERIVHNPQLPEPD
jgi:hypothetical protein